MPLLAVGDDHGDGAPLAAPLPDQPPLLDVLAPQRVLRSVHGAVEDGDDVGGHLLPLDADAVEHGPGVASGFGDPQVDALGLELVVDVLDALDALLMATCAM